jgi:Chitobiase/beta-hexosaminidase C-terminal domain/Bacterial Ig domain
MRPSASQPTSVSNNFSFSLGDTQSAKWAGLRYLCVAGALAVIASCAGAQDVTTWHYDNARSGVQSHETTLTPSNVNSSSFGKVFSFLVAGDVYAQPLYLSQYTMSDGKPHNVLIVATAEDYVYAFDADGNNPAQGYLWRDFLVNSGETWLTPVDVNGNDDIAPSIGIISTPVIDRSGGTIYVVSRSKTTTGITTYFQRLHALNVADGNEKLNGPTTIQATVKGLGDGGTTITFNAQLHNQRPALLLAPTPSAGSGNAVFIAWASHGDHGKFHGWVMAYDAANIAIQLGAWVDTPNGVQAGIWMSGGGPSTDGQGNIFLASGNGTFDANNGGSDYGDTAFRLTLGSSLALADYFTPADQKSLDDDDQDFGSGAVMLLPTQSGSVPHLAMTIDKTGTIYLINRDQMGGFTTPSNSSRQSFSGGSANRSSFAFFNNVLYAGIAGSPLQAWTFDPSTELFNTTAQSKSSETYGCNCNGAGSTPSVSANGTTNGIVWTLDNGAFSRLPAILHAYDPADLATEYYNTTQAANRRDAPALAVKFTTPTIANGKVYVGGRNAISIYGLLSKGPLTATPDFTLPTGTYSGPQTVTITDSTPDASIYFTTNGQPASTGSTLYSGPIQVTASETLEAVAIAPGYSQSSEEVASYTINNGPACSVPTNPGVHVCGPVNGSTVSSPVTAQAAATVTGTISRMEVFADGINKYTTYGTTLTKSVSLSAGEHRFDFYAVNTAGAKWKTTVYATVQ